MKNRSLALICTLLLLLSLTGCRKGTDGSMTIAEQYGLAYAPVQVMRVLGLIEKRVPDAQVNWDQVGNTAAIREAMIAGHVDIGFGAIPPFLIGYEHGMSWRISSGVSQAPVGLITTDSEINTIADLGSKDTIALPQPGSIQHMLLSMEAQKLLGTADALDSNILTMSHPDGYQALISNSITAHFTSPPYIFREQGLAGARMILSGEEAFGAPFTFIVGYATEEFHEKEPELYEAFTSALQEAIDLITEDPTEAAALLADVYELEPSVIEAYLREEGMIFSSEILGMEHFGSFMYEQGYLEDIPVARELLVWE
mgnify:CR=1 FL=1